MFIGRLPETTNREDYEWIGELIDDDTGDQVDLSTATIIFEISDGSDTIARGQTADGTVMLVDTGTFKVSIPRSTMVRFNPGTFNVGVTITINAVTKSLFTGEIAILPGNVPI